jgi:acetylxylan esterase
MQGGQIMDNAVCGGPDSGSGITSTNPPISAAALGQIKAIILMGSPRYVAGLSYNVGTCTAQGVSHTYPTPTPLLRIPYPLNHYPYHPPTTNTNSLQFAARPRGYTCASNSSSKIQNYCDGPDPYCCTGNDANLHQQYGSKYGQQALNFVKSKLSNSGGGGGGTPTTPVDPGPTNGGGGGGSCSALWAQCGGQGWNGPTCCSQGTCRASNQWYSQCLN